MAQMGYEMNYPSVIAARKEMSWKWMQETISTAEAAPITGVCRLD